MVNQIIKIQKYFRGWNSRLISKQKRRDRWNHLMMLQYKLERRQTKQASELRQAKEKVKLHYIQEKRERQMAKFMGNKPYQMHARNSVKAISKMFSVIDRIELSSKDRLELFPCEY